MAKRTTKTRAARAAYCRVKLDTALVSRAVACGAAHFGMVTPKQAIEALCEHAIHSLEDKPERSRRKCRI